MPTAYAYAYATRCKSVWKDGKMQTICSGGAPVPAKTPVKPPTSGRPPPKGKTPRSGGTILQSAYCPQDCDAKPFFENLLCRIGKGMSMCGGKPGGPDPSGNPFNFSGLAPDPQIKGGICGKACGGLLDIGCQSAKVQAGCGGCWFGLPDFGVKNGGCWIIPGIIVMLLLIFLFKPLRNLGMRRSYGL